MMRALPILVTLFVSSTALAEPPARSPGFSAGFELTEMGQDFGLGLNITTPFFINGYLAFRARGGVAWVEAIPANKRDLTWLTYATARVGAIGVGGHVADAIRIYGEGGVIGIFPIQEEISDDAFAIGGYGLFGFELFMAPEAPVSYSIELGGVGTGAHANKTIGKPGFANGFIVNVGVRFYPMSPDAPADAPADAPGESPDAPAPDAPAESPDAPAEVHETAPTE